MKANPQNHCSAMDFVRFGGGILMSAALLLATQPVFAQNAQSQARMSQMLNQFEQGKRPTYSTGGGRSMGRASGMPGYANMLGGGRPSNMGGYAGHGGGSSQMMQMMKQRMARMQNGGGGGGMGGGSLLQMMRQKQGGAPNMMPGMGGGPGAGMGMQSGLFAKMMQQDASFNNNMRRNQMSQGMRPGGMMGMRRPGMGMSGMGMNRPGMGMSGMGMPGMGMGKSGMGMPGGTSALLGRMGQQRSAPRVGSPFAPKPAAPAKTGTLSDLEKQMESQYGK